MAVVTGYFCAAIVRPCSRVHVRARGLQALNQLLLGGRGSKSLKTTELAKRSLISVQLFNWEPCKHQIVGREDCLK